MTKKLHFDDLLTALEEGTEQLRSKNKMAQDWNALYGKGGAAQQHASATADELPTPTPGVVPVAGDIGVKPKERAITKPAELPRSEAPKTPVGAVAKVVGPVRRSKPLNVVMVKKPSLVSRIRSIMSSTDIRNIGQLIEKEFGIGEDTTTADVASVPMPFAASGATEDPEEQKKRAKRRKKWAAGVAFKAEDIEEEFGLVSVTYPNGPNGPSMVGCGYKGADLLGVGPADQTSADAMKVRRLRRRQITASIGGAVAAV